VQLHYPHPSPLTVDSKGISPPNDITCSYAYMAMLCVLSVLQATNTHYIWLCYVYWVCYRLPIHTMCIDRWRLPLLQLCAWWIKPHLVSYPEAEAQALWQSFSTKWHYYVNALWDECEQVTSHEIILASISHNTSLIPRSSPLPTVLSVKLEKGNAMGKRLECEM